MSNDKVAKYLTKLTNVEVAGVWEITPYGKGMRVNWEANGVGFGQLTFRQTPDDGLTVETEYMSDEFIEAVMIQLARNAKKIDR